MAIQLSSDWHQFIFAMTENLSGVQEDLTQLKK